MILIADGGSTKTDWRLISPQSEIISVQTIGFNPYLSTTAEIEQILWKELDPFLGTRKVKQVIYYGAGCSTSSKNEIVSSAIRPFFPEAEISIYHDLLGAARALCGDQPGIACILGTGSNSCLYDGNDIIENVPSLGYFFGDEGSGAYLGKMLLKAYLHDELPHDLKEAFKVRYPLSLENILDAVYNKGKPSRFLASFSEFIFEKQEHSFINKLITANFTEFFRYFVLRYTNYNEYPVNFVGSIAFLYQSLLKDVALEFGIHIGCIKRTPIDGLVEFHSIRTDPSIL
jgi:N-acetylglucosamine kinase-like BadF-type ATPase